MTEQQLFMLSYVGGCSGPGADCSKFISNRIFSILLSFLYAPVNYCFTKTAGSSLQLLRQPSHPVLSLLHTHADKSRRSMAFIRVCVCVCVCPHNRTNSAETTITTLVTGIVHHESWLYPFNIRSKGQRSRSHGHKMQKHISVESDWVAAV